MKADKNFTYGDITTLGDLREIVELHEGDPSDSLVTIRESRTHRGEFGVDPQTITVAVKG